MGLDQEAFDAFWWQEEQLPVREIDELCP